jgi:hypothetical protein
VQIWPAKLVLLNFPQYDESQADNFAQLTGIILDEERGSIRVKSDDLDETVYFLSVPQGMSDWFVGVSFDTARIQISFIGAIILVVQAIVVAAIIIFILTTVRERKKVTVGVKPAVQSAEEVVAVPSGSAGNGVEEAEREAPAAAQQAPSAEPVDASAEIMEGIISLEEVEEVTELKELGEAEVADEYSESGLEEMVSPPAADRVEDAEEVQETEAPDLLEELVEAGAGVEDEAPVEAENTVETEEKELEQLEAVQREIMGPEAHMLEEFNELDELEKGESPAEPVNTGVEEKLIDDVTAVENRQSGIPELEALAQFDYREEVSGTAVGADAESELHERKSKGSEWPDQGEIGAVSGEEMRRLIERIDDGETSQWAELHRQFEDFLVDIGLSKGAVMHRTGSGRYEAAITCGLSAETAQRLHFSGKERIFGNILSKNKILFIQNDAFVSGELRNKFDLADSSAIKSLYFVPLYRGQGNLPGFIIVSITTGEPVDQQRITKEIKKIKKQLTNII